jgi:hypothetical protein
MLTRTACCEIAFRTHPAYLAARDIQKFLILGRKGAGKTAIFKRLITEREYNVFAYGHSFDDYPWQHHDLQAETGAPEERRYVHSWRYLILVGLAKMLLNYDQSQPWNEESFESLIALEEFVVDSYGSRDPDLRQLFSPEKELRFKGTLRLPVLQLSGERVRVRELPVHIQDVNRAVQEHILRTLNPNNTYYVCFDQLDLGVPAQQRFLTNTNPRRSVTFAPARLPSGDPLGFSKTQPEYHQRLIGLILAARDLFIAGRNNGKKLNVVVFLRDDIYQDLQFEDKNKITENHATYVKWSESGGELTLKRLMESRFTEVLASGDKHSVKWEEVFDETKEMPSRQKKYRHICDRTFLRPRDMIKFCNDVLEAYKTTDNGENRFDNTAIHTARDGYLSTY